MTATAQVFGGLGRDAELKFGGNGKPFITFSIASNTGYGDKKVTSWYDVISFGANSEKIAEWLKKGVKVLVDGELSIRKYTADNGKEYVNVQIRANNITFTQSKADNRQASASVPDGLQDAFDPFDDDSPPF